jgi:rhodanese-related sulfurtransferase
VILDARSPESYAKAHVPGSINFPHRTMNAETTASLSRDKIYVTYCDGTGCNASTRAALRLSELGFRAKEMVGGLDWWVRVDGYPVTLGAQQGTLRQNAAITCGC